MRSDGVAAMPVIPIVKHDFITETVLILRIMLQRGEADTSLPFSSRPGSAGLQLSLLRTDHDVPHPRKHAPRGPSAKPWATPRKDHALRAGRWAKAYQLPMFGMLV